MEKRIAEILMEWVADAGLHSSVQFSYDRKTGVLTIYTCSPNYMLGWMYRLRNKYDVILASEIEGYTEFKLVETSVYQISRK